MADDELETTTDDDAEEGFSRAIENLYEKGDREDAEREDGMQEEEEEEDADDDDDEDDAEHPAAKAEADPDGDDDDDDADSTEGDDDEHPDDDESDDSDDDAANEDDDDEAEEPADEEEDVAERTKELLKANGADLNIDDLPAAAQKIVRAKIKGVDAAFTRVMQAASEMQEQRATWEGEQAFQKANPELFIAQLLNGNPDLITKVQARLDKLDDPDIAAAFDVNVANQRAKAIVDARTKLEAEQRYSDRGEAVESLAKRLAAKADVPWELVEDGVVLALQNKPQGQVDLTDAEVAAVVAKVARVLGKSKQETARADSKKRVVESNKKRNKVIALTPPKPVKGAVVIPKKKAEPEIDYDDEDSRQAAMMRTARREMPGRK